MPSSSWRSSACDGLARRAARRVGPPAQSSVHRRSRLAEGRARGDDPSPAAAPRRPGRARRMRRVLLGTWDTPAGNAVDVYLSGEGRVRQITCAWDRYPLSSADEQYYRGEILPALTRRAQEYLE